MLILKYGFTLPSRGQLATPERLGSIAKKAEELGFDALLAGDHILVPRNISSTYPYTEGGEFPGAGGGDWLEHLTLLSYLAGQTTRILLATSVLIVPYRLFDLMCPLYSHIARATDVLESGLANLNALIHPVGMVIKRDTLNIPRRYAGQY